MEYLATVMREGRFPMAWRLECMASTRADISLLELRRTG